MHPILEMYCKVNNFGNQMGMELTVLSPGEITYKMTITDIHLSNPLAAHGGAVAALMDAVLGVAALSLAVEKNLLVSTVEFKLNFFKAVKPGNVLTGHGKVVFEGKSLVHSMGEIKNENGELVSTGSGTFNKYPVEKNFTLSPFSE
jgi:uncharacterized protein (TIGR00369 family)